MQYSEFEVLVVSIAAGLPLKHPDLSVHYFQFTGADTVLVPVEDKWSPYH